MTNLRSTESWFEVIPSNSGTAGTAVEGLSGVAIDVAEKQRATAGTAVGKIPPPVKLRSLPDWYLPKSE